MANGTEPMRMTNGTKAAHGIGPRPYKTMPKAMASNNTVTAEVMTISNVLQGAR